MSQLAHPTPSSVRGGPFSSRVGGLPSYFSHPPPPRPAARSAFPSLTPVVCLMTPWRTPTTSLWIQRRS